MKNPTIIKLSTGKVLNLLDDDLTTEDIRAMSGKEVRMVRDLQWKIAIERSDKELMESYMSFY